MTIEDQLKENTFFVLSIAKDKRRVKAMLDEVLASPIPSPEKLDSLAILSAKVEYARKAIVEERRILYTKLNDNKSESKN